MKRISLIFIVCLILAGASIITYQWIQSESTPKNEITLYGNVDLRLVNLSFIISERVAEVFVDEGMVVKKGQALAQLETVRLLQSLNDAIQGTKAALSNYERVKNGPRLEEIDQARALVSSAEATLHNAKLNLNRLDKLIASSAISKQDLDDAQAAYDVAQAKLNVSQKSLELLLAGSRIEDITQAKAQYQQALAYQTIKEQAVKDATLYAPSDAVVRNRILEVGDIASPNTPIYNLSLMNTKWVRAYLTEMQLAKVPIGSSAEVFTDAFPNQPIKGTVGFISSQAEFTPKNVETPELRVALVYEVRILVYDPQDMLRLGAPATVKIKTIEPTKRTSL